MSNKEIFIYFMIGLGLGFAGYILPFFLHLIKVWCLSLSLSRTRVSIQEGLTGQALLLNLEVPAPLIHNTLVMLGFMRRKQCGVRLLSQH